MLSFFRSKSSEASVVDKIVNGTKNLAIEVDETPIDAAANMQTISDNNDNTKTTSLQSLGYQNETELKETIYGKWVDTIHDLFRFVNQEIQMVQ